MGLASYRGAVITKRGKLLLAEEINDLDARHKKSVEVNGDRAARRPGDTGNGMSAKDEVTRQHDNLRYRLQEKTKLYDEATVAEAPVSRETLEIDCVARLRRRSHGRNIYVWVHVVGFGEGDCDSTPRSLSYNAPLIAPFYRQRRGYEEEVTIGKVTLTYRLMNIYLLTDPEVALAIEQLKRA